jgi:hypothetical protein
MGLELTEEQENQLQKELEKNEELIRVKIEKELDLNGIKAQHDIFEKQAKRKISRVAQMGLSNSQAESLDWEELVAKAEETVRAKIEEGSKITDEETKKQVNELKTKVAELSGQIHEKEELLKVEVEKVKNDYESKLTRKEIELIAKKKSSETNWFKNESADKLTKLVLQEIESNYDIKPDGSLLAKDGSKALAPDGKNVWKSIDDAWVHYSADFVKQSNEGGGEGDKNIRKPNDGQNIPAWMAKQLAYVPGE